MPANFGILPEFTPRIRNKRQRYEAYRDRAHADLQTWITTHDLSRPNLSERSTPVTVAV
jgi:methylenetetrahydrofolate--tRNA-(uracil-5-)-methyltransferase